jgi:hypothetical protein
LDLLHLSPLFKAARKGAKLGWEGLERIQQTSEALPSGKRVQDMTSDWQRIALQFKDAADKINRAPLPSTTTLESPPVSYPQ